MFVKYDNVNAHIIDCHPAERNIVKRALTFNVESAYFTKKFQKGWWDGKRRFLQGGAMFPTGLLPIVKNALEENDFTLDARLVIDDPGKPEPITHLRGITAFDFQRRVVTEALQCNRGIIKSVTGSGKTEMAIMMANSILSHNRDRIGYRVLWLTHSKDLLYQSMERFQKRLPEARTGIIGDGKWRVGDDVTVAMVDTLYKRLKKQESAAWDLASKVDAIFVDEAHLASSEKFVTSINACVNAWWRYGLTATPELRGQVDNVTVQGMLGNVIVEVGAKELIDLGLLSEPHITFIRTRCQDLVYDKRKKPPWNKIYAMGIVQNGQRNAEIVRRTLQMVRRGLPTLVLVNHINHGLILNEALGRFVRLDYVHGGLSADERQAGMNNLANGKINVLISSTIMDIGVDIPEIGAVVLAGGMKSSVKTFQRVGRGMRRHATKQIVKVIDFIDEHDPLLYRHSKTRYKDCSGEPGYITEVLTPPKVRRRIILKKSTPKKRSVRA